MFLTNRFNKQLTNKKIKPLAQMLHPFPALPVVSSGVYTSPQQPHNAAFRPPCVGGKGGTSPPSPPELGSQCGFGVSPSRALGVDLGGEKDLCIHGSLSKGREQ